jgi:ribosomal protein L40E
MDSFTSSTCSNCSAAVPSGAQFCPQCGTRAAVNTGTGTQICQRCSVNNPPESKYCVACGFKLGFNVDEIAKFRVVSVDSKILSGDEYNTVWSWKVVIENKTSVNLTFCLEIKYCDADDYVLASDFKSDIVSRSGTTMTITNTVYIETLLAEKVTNINAQTLYLNLA